MTNDFAWAADDLIGAALAEAGSTTVADGWWNRRADAFGRFYAERGRAPSGQSDDVDERTLASWLDQQQAEANRNARSSTPARRARLDALMPMWNGPKRRANRAARKSRRAPGAPHTAKMVGPAVNVREMRWNTKLESLRTFYVAHGRWPDSRSPDAEERGLFNWLTRQRDGARASETRFTATRRARMDERLPTWNVRFADLPRSASARARPNPRRAWRTKANAVKRFVIEHGRLPSASSPDAAEQRLGVWLATQQRFASHGDVRFTVERRVYLDKSIPTWQQPAHGIWDSILGDMFGWADNAPHT